MSEPILSIDGEVHRPRTFSFESLLSFPATFQIADISRIDPKRKGDAVMLEALLALAAPKETATYLTLHASADDFHASIPLEAVRNQALLIYGLHGQPLPASAGGPVRFFIPNFAACHTAEVDECSNVKFVDRIELTAGRGQDNRPPDEGTHAALHEKERTQN